MVDKISIMNRARIQKRRDRDALVKRLAAEEFERNKHDPPFLSGVVLYWAEGTRLNKNYRKYQLAFTNSDPGLISFYCKFLKKYFKNIDNRDWRAGLFLYPDIDHAQAIAYWSRVLNITPKQFIKSQILKSNIKQNKKLAFGTCCVYVNSKDACITMQTWIDTVSALTRG